MDYTEVEAFLDKRVLEMRQTAGENSRRGATKKRESSRTLLSINLHFSVFLPTVFFSSKKVFSISFSNYAKEPKFFMP